MEEQMSLEAPAPSKKRPASRSSSPERPKKLGKKEHSDLDEDLVEDEVVLLPETGWLPSDLLFGIFYVLGRTDLMSCSLVCKQWKQVSGDERLQWVPIALSDMEAPLHGLHATRYKAVMEECKLKNKDDKLALVAPDGTVYLRNIRLPGIGTWKAGKLLDPSSAEWLQIKCDPVWNKEEDSVLSWKLEVLLHVIKFEEAVLNDDFRIMRTGPYEPDIKSFVFSRVAEHLKNALKRFQKHKYCDSNIPQTEAPLLKQPANVKVPLFQYQLEAVSWMKYIEAQTVNDVSYCSLVSWSALKTEILFDMQDEEYKTEKDLDAFKSSVSVKGGVIADEMGLGKTLQVVSLVLTDPVPEEELKKPVQKNASGSYISRATLVHCPNHLAKQWKDEIEKNTQGKVALCCTIKDFDKLTVESICRDYDFIIVSFQFLKNTSYEKFLASRKPGKSPSSSEAEDLSKKKTKKKAESQSSSSSSSEVKKTKKKKAPVKGTKKSAASKSAKSSSEESEEESSSSSSEEVKNTTKKKTATKKSKSKPIKGKKKKEESSSSSSSSSSEEKPKKKTGKKAAVKKSPKTESKPIKGKKKKEESSSSSSSSSSEEKPKKKTAKKAAKVTKKKKEVDDMSVDESSSKEEKPKKKAATKKKTTAKAKAPKGERAPLADFYWKRIVLDEGHELVHGQEMVRYTNPPRYKDVTVPILDFNSQYRWYVTGTPFPNDATIRGAMKFLIPSIDRDQLEEGIEIYSNWVIFDLLLNNFYWRNTKESISSDEYNLPPYKNEIILLDFHPIERALYNDCVGEPANQLRVCSYSLYDPSRNDVDQVFTSLEQARSKISQRRQLALPSAKEAESSAKKTYDNRLLRKNDFDSSTMIVAALNRWKNATAKRVALEQQVKIWAKVKPVAIPKPIGVDADDSDETPLDLETISNDREKLRDELRKLGKPTGGGLYSLKTRYSQALAQKAMKDEKLRSKELKSGVIRQFATEEDKILRYGTKITKLLGYLRDLWKRQPEAKVIVFSKYPIMLREINELLAGDGVPSVTVQGNIFCRNKAIVAFASGCSVILLGLGTAASGTNLTAATHVILVDPMSGSPKEVRAAEAQAIARAHRRGQEKVVTIVRFIIKDTIELTTFTSVYGTDDLPKEVAAETEAIETKTFAKPMMIRTNSLSTLAVANKLKRTSSLADLMASELQDGKEVL